MKRLFILRPQPGAGETAERARALGIEPVVAPLFDVQPVPWEAPEPSQFDGLLLTSANAVRHGGAQLERLRGLPVHAVGAATAQAAWSAGLKVATRGDSGVDRLLGSLEGGLKLLHLCGEHRHGPHSARQQIMTVIAYRSTPTDPPSLLDQLPGAVAVIHSPRAAERLAELIDRSTRPSVRIAAISPIAAQAAGDGWAIVEPAAEPRDEALLALAARLCEKAPQE